jgi:hypothetical protein
LETTSKTADIANNADENVSSIRAISEIRGSVVRLPRAARNGRARIPDLFALSQFGRG